MRWMAVAGVLGVLACANRVTPEAPAPVVPDAPRPAAANSPGLTLMIAADLRGYLAPCGCTENMRGGIARAVAQLDEARQGGRPLLFIDAGNSLFGAEQLPEAKVPQDERKARALAEAFGLMKLDLRGVGRLDEARGAGFARSLGLPTLETGAWRLLEGGGRPIGVVSARTEQQLKQGSRAARLGGAQFVVALFQQPLAAAQKAATDPALEADLIVVADAGPEPAGEENKLVRGRVPVVQVQSKGRSLVRVDLTFGGVGDFELARTRFDVERELYATGERMEILKRQISDPRLSPQARELRQAKLEELAGRHHALQEEPPPTSEGKNSFGTRFVALETTLPSSPAGQELLTRYDHDVGLLNLGWAKQHGRDCPAPPKGEAGFVGNPPCRACHAQTFAVWEGSKHARGYETLREGAKQYHLDCITCHVTGWQQPGGVCRVDKVQGREGVGCESCHGPGSLHVQAPQKANILGRPDQAQCVGCHNAENSPHFNHPAYLPQVLGPGHGAPGL
ncbi:MAG: cytochrome C [Myxococcota bacterium]|nr:cytochrome C [Myxococcota bacterium]